MITNKFILLYIPFIPLRYHHATKYLMQAQAYDSQWIHFPRKQQQTYHLSRDIISLVLCPNFHVVRKQTTIISLEFDDHHGETWRGERLGLGAGPVRGWHCGPTLAERTGIRQRGREAVEGGVFAAGQVLDGCSADRKRTAGCHGLGRRRYREAPAQSYDCDLSFSFSLKITNKFLGSLYLSFSVVGPTIQRSSCASKQSSIYTL